VCGLCARNCPYGFFIDYKIFFFFLQLVVKKKVPWYCCEYNCYCLVCVHLAYLLSLFIITIYYYYYYYYLLLFYYYLLLLLFIVIIYYIPVLEIVQTRRKEAIHTSNLSNALIWSENEWINGWVCTDECATKCEENKIIYKYIKICDVVRHIVNG
jgi:ferredoxin